jgi:AAA domain, putative AbiEii toxin, Type IV TA system/AAA ATPase domain
MLVSMKLINFRCFREHEFTFGPLNVCVGVNNAGKSTLAEALRIVALASSRIKTSLFREPPDWLSIPRTNEGFSFSLQGQQINFETMFHRYGEPPATIRADFGAFGRLLIYVASAAKTHCIVYNGAGKMLKTREAATKAGFPLMDALPQVGPVAVEETILNPSYVRGALSSRLAPIHFRNQLNLLYDQFPEFQRVVAEGWRGLSVVELIHHGGEQGKDLFLQIRDGDFVGEIGTMGHGLQMWLQTMWFLIRARHATTLILDEPDVYMHADLQRKLIRTVRELGAQIIVTTHSTEIMSEVAPEEILVIDKKLAESKRADSLPAVQAVLTRLGSAQNIHLFRLWSAKRFILVEGADLRLLQGFQNVLLPESAAPIMAIPNASFGGWGGWSHALGSSIAMASAAGSQIATYTFLDSDYHNQSQVEQIYSEFARHHCQVHVWCKKEIENYLLNPGAVTKAIVSKLPKRASPPSESEVRNKMNEFAVSLTEEMFDAVAQEFISVNRGLGVGGANKAAREAIDKRIQRDGLLSCVSGKSVIQKLFSWVQNEFGASLNTLTICRQFTAEDLEPELKGVLSAIENATALPARSQASY